MAADADADCLAGRRGSCRTTPRTSGRREKNVWPRPPAPPRPRATPYPVCRLTSGATGPFRGGGEIGNGKHRAARLTSAKRKAADLLHGQVVEGRAARHEGGRARQQAAHDLNGLRRGGDDLARASDPHAELQHVPSVLGVFPLRKLVGPRRCCHVAVRRKRSVGASRIIRPLRPRPATCS